MNKKIVALVLVCVLIFSTVVAGTLAYLQVKTDPVTNTFTFGDVGLTLTETARDYKIVPNTTLPKDPKITVTKGGEDCYVFVKVEESANLDTFITYAIATGWTELTGEGVTAGTVFYRTVTANETQDQSFDVLTGNQVTCNDVTKQTITDNNGVQPTLTFTGYAVQQAGFDSALAAWNQVKNMA